MKFHSKKLCFLFYEFKSLDIHDELYVHFFTCIFFKVRHIPAVKICLTFTLLDISPKNCIRVVPTKVKMS